MFACSVCGHACGRRGVPAHTKAAAGESSRTCTCTYQSAYAHARARACACACKYVCVRARVQARGCACARMSAHVRARARIRSCAHIFVCTRAHKCARARMHLCEWLCFHVMFSHQKVIHGDVGKSTRIFKSPGKQVRTFIFRATISANKISPIHSIDFTNLPGVQFLPLPRDC